MDIDLGNLRDVLIRFIVLVCSLALHEWGHAVMADKLGDDTPRSQGRLTLNPLSHIDPIGTILIPLLGALGFFGSFSMIGWAKPIYTNPSNFRRGQYDQAWVTIAGPGVNLCLAILATFGAAFASRFFPVAEPLFISIITINVGLFVFNLLPIPPLDGSKFLMYWFGMSEDTYSQFARYGGILLLVLINITVFRQFLSVIFNFALLPFDRLLSLIT